MKTTILKFIKEIIWGPTLKESELIGNWICKKINNKNINSLGFNKIRLSLNADHSLIQETNMNSFDGDFSTKSSGNWEIINNLLIVTVGGHKSKCAVNLKNSRIRFNPDPIFKEERIKFTDYVKTEL